MKHVIIAGPGRCGKTTLALKLSENFGLVHYKFDTIIRGARKYFYNDVPLTWKEISPLSSGMIYSIISESKTDIIKNKEYYCIDTCHCYPKDIHDLGLDDEIIIIYLGFPNIALEEKLNIVRQTDCKESWTHTKTDDELLHSLSEGIEFSKETKEQCEEYGYPYFDTGKDFKLTLNKAYKYIESELNK